MKPYVQNHRKGSGKQTSHNASMTRLVRIGDLVRDDALNMRDKLRPDKIRDYANVIRSGGELPPVRAFDVEGILYLIDGWHRVAAHERHELSEVWAEIAWGTLEEAKVEAARANLKHGLPLTRKERRRAFQAYIAGQGNRDGERLKSYREIVTDLGGVVTVSTVWRWMEADFPDMFASMQGGWTVDTSQEDAREWPAPNPEARFLEEASRHLNNSLLFLPLISPVSRKRILGEFQQALKAQRRSACPFDF